MARWGSLIFQDRFSPLMEQLIFFHDHVLLILVIVICLVMYVILTLSGRSYLDMRCMEGHEIEIV